MPSAPVGQPNVLRPDFVLGDRFGASCDLKLTRLLKEILTARNYEVQVNRPYAGGFITEHYGRPGRGFHALQLEMNRALYLNEATFEQTAGFELLRHALTQSLDRLMRELPELLGRRAAAE